MSELNIVPNITEEVFLVRKLPHGHKKPYDNKYNPAPQIECAY